LRREGRKEKVEVVDGSGVHWKGMLYLEEKDGRRRRYAHALNCMLRRSWQAVSGIVLVACLAWASAPLLAQAAPTQAIIAPPATSTAPVVEAQPSLTVDRDPVASPDDATSLPADTTGSAAPYAASSAQPSTTTAENGQFVFHENVNEVVLNVTVIDKHQRLVTTLSQPNFTVFEDDIPQKISAFRHEDIPVSLGILIDNSGSMRDKRAAVNRAALDMVLASNPEDESFIVNFADDAYLDQDFTSSIPKLQQGLSHIDSRGGTALYDAVIASADHLAQDAQRPKQVLLIITDGEDNSSGSTLVQTVRRIQDLQGPIIYSIGLLFGDDGGEAHRARRALQQLSNETGGLAYFPDSLEQVDKIAAQVAKDIRNQYTLGYHPSKPENEGDYRTIRVEVHAKDMGKLSARTRAGYYPGKQKKSTSTGLVSAPQNANGLR